MLWVLAVVVVAGVIVVYIYKHPEHPAPPAKRDTASYKTPYAPPPRPEVLYGSNRPRIEPGPVVEPAPAYTPTAYASALPLPDNSEQAFVTRAIQAGERNLKSMDERVLAGLVEKPTSHKVSVNGGTQRLELRLDDHEVEVRVYSGRGTRAAAEIALPAYALVRALVELGLVKAE